MSSSATLRVAAAAAVLVLCATGARPQAAEPKAAAQGLEQFFKPDSKVWQMSTEEFARAQQPNGFAWASGTATDSARLLGPGLRFAGIPLMDAQAQFEGGRLKHMLLYVYTRGDAGDLTKEDFDEIVAEAQRCVTAWAGSEPSPAREKTRATGAVLAYRAWAKEPHRVDLEWSFTKKKTMQGTTFPFTVEFIRLQIAQFDPADDPRRILSRGTETKEAAISLLELKKNVGKLDNGDVVINGIPMVDQGAKGYCAAAAASRVLQYYGRNIDQHEIAQLARSGALTGTDPRIMVHVLARAGADLGIVVKNHVEMNEKTFVDLVDRYNRAARRRKVPEIMLGPVMNAGEILAEMDTAVLKESRINPRTAIERFKADIVKYVNVGIPLAWAVILGKIEENPPVPQAGGGHMRLIIGYSPKVAEVLYTDSWGVGHELKRMPVEDAWTITVSLHTLEPRR